MTLLLAAGLFGIAVSCLAWTFSSRLWGERVLAHRISTLGGEAVFPYDLSGSLLKKEDVLIADPRKLDGISRGLYLAGIRSNRRIRFYRFLTRLSLVFPLLLIAVGFVSGSATKWTYLLSLSGGMFFYTVLVLWIRMLKARYQQVLTRSLPEFLDLLVVCLEAGLNFTAALPRVIRETPAGDPLAKEFNVMHHEFLSGIPFADACERLARRCDLPELSVILSAVVQSEQMGSSLSNTLRIQAVTLRDKYRQRMREKARKIPIKILFPILLILGGSLMFPTLSIIFFKLLRGLEEGGMLTAVP